MIGLVRRYMFWTSVRHSRLRELQMSNDSAGPENVGEWREAEMMSSDYAGGDRRQLETDDKAVEHEVRPISNARKMASDDHKHDDANDKFEIENEMVYRDDPFDDVSYSNDDHNNNSSNTLNAARIIY